MMKNRSIKTRICISAILLTLFSTIIISVTTAIISTSYMRSNVCLNIQNEHEIIGQEIKNIINYTNYLHSELLLDADFRSIVLSNDDPSTKSEKMRELTEKFSINRIVYDFSIISEDSSKSFPLYNHFSVNGSNQIQLLNDTISNKSIAKFGKIEELNGERYITVSKQVNIPYISSLKMVIIYYINESVIRDCYSASTTYPDSDMFVSQNGYVISGAKNEFVGSTIYELKEYSGPIASHKRVVYNGKRVLVVTSPMKLFNDQYKENWNLISIIPESRVFEDITYLILLITFITILFIALSVPLLLNLTNRFTNSLIKFSDFISKNSDNKLYEIENKKEYDELSELVESYNHMVSHINYLLEKNRKDSELKRKLELDALQMQINPHFLYNVLDTISWIAKIKKQDEIQKITMALASFFRLSLHKGDKYITVNEEISIIKSYSEIEYIRRNGNFNVIYEVDQNVENIRILKLILQPLIENAFKHGIAAKKDGIITVRAYMENECLVLSIKDNGKGIGDENEKSSSALGGFGLKNLRERLYLEYKDNATIEITSEKDVFTECKIKIYHDELIV